jgi:hypothetical protein
MTLLTKEDGQSLQKMLTTKLQGKKEDHFFNYLQKSFFFTLKADNNVHFTRQLRLEKKKAKTEFVERNTSL